MNEKLELAILAEAEWWAKQILSETPQDIGSKETDEYITQGLLTAMFGIARRGVTKQQVKHFESNLASILKKELKNSQNVRLDSYISCDYHPDEILVKAAKKSGIDPNIFPVKSGTYIDFNYNVLAKRGYAKPFIEIFSQ